MYYEPFAQQKVSRAVAKGRHSVIRDVLGWINDGREHPEDEWQWVPRDASYDYTGVVDLDASLALRCGSDYNRLDIDKGC